MNPIHVCFAGAPEIPLQLPPSVIPVAHANYGLASTPDSHPIISGVPFPTPPLRTGGGLVLRDWEPRDLIRDPLLRSWSALARSFPLRDIAYGVDPGVDYGADHRIDSTVGAIAHTLRPYSLSFSYDHFPDPHHLNRSTWAPCTAYRTCRLLSVQTLIGLPSFQVISPIHQSSPLSYAHPASLPLSWWAHLRSSLHPALTTLVFISASTPAARTEASRILLDFLSFL